MAGLVPAIHEKREDVDPRVKPAAVRFSSRHPILAVAVTETMIKKVPVAICGRANFWLYN